MSFFDNIREVGKTECRKLKDRGYKILFTKISDGYHSREKTNFIIWMDRFDILGCTIIGIRNGPTDRVYEYFTNHLELGGELGDRKGDYTRKILIGACGAHK